MGYNFFSELLSITHVQNSQNYNVGSHISVGFTLVFLVHMKEKIMSGSSYMNLPRVKHAWPT